ncbi:Diguanylate cyclase DosC [Planctomycetes bacterium CA13]|uniref:diguanylate cyclase n=1 Tax=Novipirellula herctigrandis TaxID=2527986 RepID=A0A5C5Z5H6_9BACT|nr:Diguanylate cyclase DosC [Planctomycetes bacterium CA13]
MANLRNRTGPPERDPLTAFAIAKEALDYVTKFRTPPTPDIYKVWYHYVEGEPGELREQLSHAVNEAKSVSYEQLQLLHQQFFAGSDERELTQKLGEDLATTIGTVDSIIHEQLSAGNTFKDSVHKASENLSVEKTTVEELKSCIESVLASNQCMQDQLDRMGVRLEESRSQVTKLRASYLDSQRKLMTDPLTNIGNRLFFDTMMSNALEHHERGERHFVLLLVDLDKFKLINDTFGHATGDTVLRFAASNIEQIAVDASVARYGGDEFAIFFNTLDSAKGMELGETICQSFAQNKLTLNDTGEPIGKLTASIGGALLREDDGEQSWFQRADKLLYDAKNGGRNRAMVERKIN